MPLTREEQIRRERDLITELEAKVEIWETLVMEAKACSQKGLEPAIGLAYARLGLRSAREQLAAHKASLETIEGREANEQSDSDRAAGG